MRVAQISENGYQQNFEYWPSYERIKSVLNQNGNLIETKYYFGDYEKQIINGGATTDIHYINSPIGICAILLYDGTDVTTYYLQKDYLGSLNVICDVNGNLVAEQNFNAWGKARNANTWNSNDPLLAKPTWLYRGFTGHEDMPQFGLINMNARLYDPTIGKMISPDNYVSNPNHTQSYNRYAYANNNPLNKIDPTGNVPIAFYAVFWVGAVVTDYTASYLAGEDKSLEQSAADVTNSLKEVSSLSITIYSADGVSISLNPLATVLTGAPAISLGVRVNDYNTIVLNTSVSLDGGSKYSAGWVYYDKKNDNGWMFSYTAFMGNNKFVQDNLSASINNKGFRFSFSEDIFTGDKFRTGAFEVGYGPVSIGAILYTSQHGSFKEAMKNEKGFINTSRYYKSALQYQPGSDGKYSALYAGLNVGGITLRAGVNSPKVGDAVQGFIHTWGGTYLFNYGGDPHQNTPLFNWNFPTTFYGTVSPVDPLNLY
jgi:RHS repeat-associated protein